MPQRVAGVPPIASIAASAGFSLALARSGEPRGAGSSASSELGPGPALSGVPRLVPGLPADVAAIAAGQDFAVAITASGEPWAWGSNAVLQLGMTAASPGPPSRIQFLMPADWKLGVGSRFTMGFSTW